VPSDSWLRDHPAAWGACQGTWTLEGDEPAVLAVDMSLRHDSTAVLECVKLADGRTAVTARIWMPLEGVVDHLEVFTYIRDRAEELGRRFRGVVYDPRFFELPARMLEAARVEVIQFDQTPTLMAPACKETFDAIVAGQIVHDGDPELSAHVKAAVRRQQERGFTLSKGKSQRRIDAAVALCMGYWALKNVKPARNWASTVW
jgi:phage terminase large subunit-like protein